ncbi:conserved hypothetical protein [Leishmania major strain Friedlin]|uniref:Uncharacterized protein n=1 Tax=Leishmania major TaxID=5664 RepID=Q4Q4A1_LEIMA|nr:conserved hypothetical protein [Leishmania major strain Friedlin]CAG9580662.1 hypothetical_protein_-_conserved [Leishmania major strain Friedlin]CAJ06156.1 conserved hypothetical protein [Leishmania major strain Friedlin]|eukprot:XP_001685847.1 conserved hypothetical protein [Leishmania major strain Friedlin]
MYLAVFHEFAHPEVLENVKAEGICDVDVAPEPNKLAASEEEQQVLRCNAKLITVKHNITGIRDVFDGMTEAELVEIDGQVEQKLQQLVALGFQVVERHPRTSAGRPMLDRVILSYPA